MSLIESLTPEQRKRWETRDFEKGEILFREGERCEALGLVEKGQIDIVSFSYEGGEILYKRVRPGAMFGNHLLFSSDPFYRGNVIARTKGRVLRLQKADLLRLLAENPVFLEGYLEAQADNAKALNARIKVLSLPSLKERLFYGIHLHGGRWEFASVASLSRELGVERETLSRLLSRLSKDKAIVRGEHYLALGEKENRR